MVISVHYSAGGEDMAYLAAVSSSTMPIFIRTKGDVPPVSVNATSVAICCIFCTSLVNTVVLL